MPLEEELGLLRRRGVRLPLGLPHPFPAPGLRRHIVPRRNLFLQSVLQRVLGDLECIVRL